jgi:hypothetical protein
MNLTPPFSDVFSLNAFGQLYSVNFIGVLEGCTDATACNYNENASVHPSQTPIKFTLYNCPKAFKLKTSEKGGVKFIVMETV